jgi:serine/threonine protein kinase
MPTQQQQQQQRASSQNCGPYQSAAGSTSQKLCKRPRRTWQLVRLTRVVQPGAVPAGCDAVRLLQLIGTGTTGAVYKGEWIQTDAVGSSSSAQSFSSGAGAAQLAGSTAAPSNAPSYVAVKVFGNFNGFYEQERRAGLLTVGIKNVVQTIATGCIARRTVADLIAAGTSSPSSQSCNYCGCGDSDSDDHGVSVTQRTVRCDDEDAPSSRQFPCLVMSLCQGGSLEGRKLHTEDEARRYVQPLLQALADLHQRGIVARWVGWQTWCGAVRHHGAC